MKKILVLGLGQIGRAILYYLSRINDMHDTEEYELHGFDLSNDSINALSNLLPPHANVVTHLSESSSINPEGFPSVRHVIEMVNPDIVISALPYSLNPIVAYASLSRDIPYLDLGGSDVGRHKISNYAREQSTAAMTDLGLAPGLINIMAERECSLGNVTSVKMYVGGIPANPNVNPLKYTLNWSPEGLINEYTEDCSVLSNGLLVTRPGMSDREVIITEQLGPLEAFNTSGGAATSIHSMMDRGVVNCQYKTLRYLGHLEIVKFLFDSGVSKESLTNMFKFTKPTTDLAILVLNIERGYDISTIEKIYYPQNGMSAMQASTAAPVAVVADLILTNKMHTPPRLLTYEDIPMDSFFELLDNLLL